MGTSQSNHEHLNVVTVTALETTLFKIDETIFFSKQDFFFFLFKRTRWRTQIYLLTVTIFSIYSLTFFMHISACERECVWVHVWFFFLNSFPKPIRFNPICMFCCSRATYLFAVRCLYHPFIRLNFIPIWWCNNTNCTLNALITSFLSLIYTNFSLYFY